MLARLKSLLPPNGDVTQEGTLEALLDNATAYVLAVTNRRKLSKALEPATVQIALLMYNRQGMEGESGHSEGGVNRTLIDMPDALTQQLLAYRLLKGVERT